MITSKTPKSRERRKQRNIKKKMKKKIEEGKMRDAGGRCRREEIAEKSSISWTL